MRRSIVLASAMLAGAVSAAAASPMLTFLSAERYIEAWARGPNLDPPQYAHDRLDAVGFDPFDGYLRVFVEDQWGDGVSGTATQTSILNPNGFSASGYTTDHWSSPAGSSHGYSISHFSITFQAERTGWCPLHVRIAADEWSVASYLDFTGPGADVHYEYDDNVEMPLLTIDDLIRLEAGGSYSFYLSVATGEYYDISLDVPAPATLCLAGVPLFWSSRRRR